MSSARAVKAFNCRGYLFSPQDFFLICMHAMYGRHYVHVCGRHCVYVSFGGTVYLCVIHIVCMFCVVRYSICVYGRHCVHVEHDISCVHVCLW